MTEAPDCICDYDYLGNRVTDAFCPVVHFLGDIDRLVDPEGATDMSPYYPYDRAPFPIEEIAVRRFKK